MDGSQVVPEDLREGGFPLGRRRAGIDRVLIAFEAKVRVLVSPVCSSGARRKRREGKGGVQREKNERATRRAHRNNHHPPFP